MSRPYRGPDTSQSCSWPLYQLVLIVPIIIGFAALLVLPSSTDSNATLLTLAAWVLPDWLLGLVTVAGIATAMVPAAGLLVGIASLLAGNVARTTNQRSRYWINQATVVGATALASARLVRTGRGVGR